MPWLDLGEELQELGYGDIWDVNADHVVRRQQLKAAHKIADRAFTRPAGAPAHLRKAKALALTRRRVLKYRATEKGRVAIARQIERARQRRGSVNVKVDDPTDANRRYVAKYRTTEKGRLAAARYLASEKGKAATARRNEKRKLARATKRDRKAE